MARGWESKSVEMQMEDRNSPPVPEGGNTHANAPLERERELLNLSRKRLLRELETIANPRLRDLKMRALRHIETQLEAMPETGSDLPEGTQNRAPR